MPTTIYDSSLITQRNRTKAESGSFITRISPWNVPPAGSDAQPTTSYGPALGIYNQSIINTVRNGNMAIFRKGNGACTTINNGCPCNPSTN